MHGLTNSSNGRQGFQLAIILALIVTLIQPISILSQPNPNEQIVHFNFEENEPSTDPPRLNLTYHTLTDPIDRPVTSDTVIAGDHVILKAEWSTSLVNRSRLQVFAPAIPANLTEELNSSTIEIDTRYLGNNATCTIISTSWITNESTFVETFLNVYIGNFFVPRVVITSPNGGETWTGVNNITWTASDVNIADSLRFEVLVSSNAGATFMQLTSSISHNWFEWNSTALDKLDTYLVEVRVTDGIYFSSDISDSNFTAGDIIHSTTTTTTTTNTVTNTTTATNTTSTFDSRLIAFVAILLLSSSVMAIVVYYAARKWF